MPSISISRGNTFKQPNSPSVKSITNPEWLFGTDFILIFTSDKSAISFKCWGEAHSFPSLLGSISINKNAKNNTERLSAVLVRIVTVLLRHIK